MLDRLFPDRRDPDPVGLLRPPVPTHPRGIDRIYDILAEYGEMDVLLDSLRQPKQTDKHR